MTTIGRYRVIDLLGTGGMGIVYRATDDTLRRTVALKFLAAEFASDDEYRARFLREARITASMNHANTCIVYEVGHLDQEVTLPLDERVLASGTLFIAMEFIEGETLGARLERSGPLPVRDAIDIALQVIEGLAEAHARHVVHRDLKPQNVMITPSGRVKIVDFGLAKTIRSVRDAHALVSTSEMLSADMGEGAVIGTCAYMSPEQAAGKEIDARSDVFSFGTMLFQMLTGRLPFVGDTANEMMATIQVAAPAPWPQATASAAKVFGDRYADARELLEELREIQRSVSSDRPLLPSFRQSSTKGSPSFLRTDDGLPYESDKTGRHEIYVRPFPGPGNDFLASTSGASQVRWNPNGKELFYIGADDRLMALPITASSDGKTVDFGTPRPLFATSITSPGVNTFRQQYAVSPDGRSFVLQSLVGQANASPITLILNWKPK